MDCTDDAFALRHADAPLLAAALAQGRQQTLAWLAAFEQALGPELKVPQRPEINPPLWELGHIGWFEGWWTTRWPHQPLGMHGDPDVPRAPPSRPGADALYHSGQVPHHRRWQLPLPDLAHTLADLGRQREATLALLARCDGRPDALYVFALSLFHEDMHREAWAMTAQLLGIEPPPGQPAAPAPVTACGTWPLPAARWPLGSDSAGFSFDNELPRHTVPLDACAIDRAPVSWARFLAFVDDGGYADARWWTPEGATWRQAQQLQHPRHLQRLHGRWWRLDFGRLQPLVMETPALNLSLHEAQAWCAWAGRRLPSEAEWERAAVTATQTGEPFEWGAVWEWTASAFAPYPGFRPHPYRDYSQPWFDGRPVLRGGSFATPARLKHPRFRNFFEAGRHDVFAGFRTCPA